MTNPLFLTSSRSVSCERLFVTRLLCLALTLFPLAVSAHPSPNTLVFMDVSPQRVTLELQLPLPELALSFRQEITQDPEQLIARYGPQLQEYLLAHIHAYVHQNRPWTVTVTGLAMDKGNYQDSRIPYWELNATVTLTPQAGEATRDFYLGYDVIMHQVMNHAAFVSIRSDWENGSIESSTSEAQAIAWNLQDNVVPPLHVTLGKGSWWKGFSGMVMLGVRHIAEGVDHLMFLLVLLLPAPLVVRNRRWNGFGGTRYSLIRLLKVATAFTIGHSLTLLLGALGWVQLPQQPVEILIAFSILISAIHALRPLFPGKEIFVAGGFGLVHGLAFAATITHLRLDTGALVMSILGFNIGIELMQLFVIAITVPWLLILSKHPVYKYVRITGAVLASIAAIAWIQQRYAQASSPLATIVDELTSHAQWLLLVLMLLSAAVLPGKNRG